MRKLQVWNKGLQIRQSHRSLGTTLRPFHQTATRNMKFISQIFKTKPYSPSRFTWFCLYCQFRIFQVPKLEVPTTNTAYFVGLCKGMSPPNVTFCGSSGPSNGQKSGQSNTAQRKILALLNQFLQMLRDRCLPDSGHWNARLDHGHPRFYLARRCVLKVSWACEDWEILRYDKSASKRSGSHSQSSPTNAGDDTNGIWVKASR